MNFDITLSWKKGVVLHLYKFKLLFFKNDSCQVWLKLIGEEVFLLLCYYWPMLCKILSDFFTIMLYTHISPIWTNLNPLHPRNALCQVRVKLARWFLIRGLLILSMYFCYFAIVYPWKRVRPFIWSNLKPLYPRLLCAKFGWNWPSGSWEEDENLKSYNNADDAEDGQPEKLTWAFGSGVLKISHLLFKVIVDLNIVLKCLRAKQETFIPRVEFCLLYL